jgi:hypothetical protein
LNKTIKINHAEERRGEEACFSSDEVRKTEVVMEHVFKALRIVYCKMVPVNLKNKFDTNAE